MPWLARFAKLVLDFPAVRPVFVLALVLSAGSILEARPAPNTTAEQSQAVAPEPVEQEEVVGEISPAADLKYYSWAFQSSPILQLENGPRMSYVMPDGRTILWFERRGDHKVVMLNGKPLGPEFDKHFPTTPRISADGKRIAIQGVRGKKGTIIFAGKDLLAGFDEVFNAALSSDGQKLAYGAKTGKEWSLLVNGERRAGPFDTIPVSVFSPDGAHLGYAARRGKTWVLGRDAQEHTFDDIEVLRIWVMPSGRLACAAKRKGEHFYIIDGKEGPHFDILGHLALSGDGGHYAYAGAQNKMQVVRDRATGRVVVDDRAGPEYHGMVYNSLWDLFLSKTMWSLKEGLLAPLNSAVHGVSDPVFSPDAQHLVYSVRTDADTTSVLLDDRPVAKFDRTGGVPISFSPNGKRLAVLGWRGQKLVEVRDGATFAELGNPDPINIAEHLTWSPDGQRTAFVMGHGGHLYLQDKTTQARRRVVVDGKAGAEYNCALIPHLYFSPDSKHWGYEVFGDDKRKFRSFVVVDGVEGKTYDEIIPQSLLFSEETATYVAREDRKFLRVTRKLSAGAH